MTKGRLWELLEGKDDYDIEEWTEKKPLVVDGVFIFEKDSHGGYEGAGEEHWRVLSVTDEKGKETFWKIPGYYYSHDGAYLERRNVFQVLPKEKTIIVWSALK